LLFDGVGVGFSTDFEHYKAEAVGRIADVHELAREFFKFFPNQFGFRRNGAVLNTRDGEIVKLQGICTNEAR